MKNFFNIIIGFISAIGMVLGTILVFIIGFLIFGMVIDILSF